MIQILRFTGSVKDPRGAVIPQYAAPVDVECTIAPRDSSESVKPGYENRVPTGLTLLDVTVPVAPRDRFVIDGITYEVEGRPFNWAAHTPFPPIPHSGTQVALKAV